MPAQVIVVQRPRRNRFAVPRVLPDWLRSVRTVLFRGFAGESEMTEAGSIESRSMQSPLFPQLSFDASGSHHCDGCDLCVRVCPSRCLSIVTEGEGAERVVMRFDFTRGACIGCGLCRDVCPGDAIEMVVGPTVELAALSSRCGVVDLLIDPAAKRD